MVAVRRTVKYFMKPMNRTYYMEELSKKLNIRTKDDWVKLTANDFNINGGKNLLGLYSNSIPKLLSSIYPNHQWNFDKIDYQTIRKHRRMMDKLAVKFNVNTLDDWLKVSRTQMQREVGGKNLLTEYSNDMKTLLTTLYKEHEWNFDEQRIYINDYFKEIENQRKFMDKMTRKLQLKTLNYWIFISKRKIFHLGGQSLLAYFYSGDIEKMLMSIYPNYPWNFDKSMEILENQRYLLEKIAKRLKLRSLDDWINVGRHRFLIKGGKVLLDIYGNNIKLLLSTLYPDHHWNFEKIKFRPHSNYSRGYEFNYKRIMEIIKKYSIQQKKDWYRLSILVGDVNLMYALPLIYPEEKWRKQEFIYRSKKTVQRILFLQLQQIFTIYNLYENYRHPFLINITERNLEFDVYHPAMNLAFEYQGQQHYDEIPAGFGNILSYQTRDDFKNHLAGIHDIQLITIPYWWDLTQSSLIRTLESLKYKYENCT